MLRHMMLAKLHRATVSECCLDYAGSLSVDPDLFEQVGMVVGEKIQIVNVNNGQRFETYLIEAERGSGEIIVNGAAARLCQPNDRIIIITYGLLNEAELADYKAKVIVLDEQNKVVDTH